MQRSAVATALAAITAMLLGAGFGETLYDGPATRAAARADRAARITAPSSADTPLGSPTTRFAFKLSRNSGGVAVYRTHSAAVKALALGETLAKAFGQTLKGFAAVHGNVVIGFQKHPTLHEQAETKGWLRRR